MAVEGSKMSDEEFMELDNIEIPESIREIASHYEAAHCFYKVFTDVGGCLMCQESYLKGFGLNDAVKQFF